jgi:PAS domain S-box-containing protein
MKRQSLSRPYLWLTILTSAVICVWCVVRLITAPPSALDGLCLALVVVTLVLGRRLIIQIPQGNGEITVTDTLIFLVLLLYGGEVATLLATAEAISSKTKHNKKFVTFLFAGAVMGCSTFATTHLLRAVVGPETALAHGGPAALFALGVGLLALAQFFVNTILVAVGVGLKNDQPIWHVWSHYYLWSSVIYFAGAATAGVAAHFIRAYGVVAVFVITPIITILYFTYRMYLKNVEASLAQAEQARRHALELQASEERFHGAFDYAPIGIALMKRDGECWQFNRAWRELCSYDQTEPQPGNLRDLLHPEEAGRWLEYLASVACGAPPPPPLEARLLRPRNGSLWVLLGASALQDNNNGGDYLVVQMQDITERKHAEETLRQSERLKAALLDAVTHDLRTPLTSIKASVTTLLAEFEEPGEELSLPGEVRQELLDVIDEEADRLNSIIAGHVGLARLETGALGLHRFSAALHDIVSIVQARVAGLTRGHEIEWQIDPHLPSVPVDTHAVAAVLYTLIDNAAKYTPLHTRISIKGWQEEAGFIRLAVDDNGAGIPAHLRTRVFEKFFRVPSHNQPEANGTGLGLAIAKGIVEAHGGRIWVEDAPAGQGARFVFTLPTGVQSGAGEV